MLRRGVIEIDKIVIWLIIIAVVVVLLLFMARTLSVSNCESLTYKLLNTLGIADTCVS